MTDLNDKQLLEAVRQHEAWAFEELFNRYWHPLYETAYKKLQSREDARDIVQDVWLSFWNNVETVTVDEHLGPYLFTALRNKILHFYSRNKVRLAFVTQQFSIPVYESGVPATALELKELKAVVFDEVQKMPGRMQQIYDLSRNRHLSIAEIAEHLNLAPQTVKNQLHNALERLRTRLSRYNANLIVLFVIAGVKQL
ncbi:RNA polymerase sigma factor [Segetibacter sp. 3557_3]|uniref:RNA polymerase sigma factor n=1 Tax=Segetibacter sp. 3557_3 TaxID=2547429 RepID=UPI001404C21B|nr:sigma-70 family RNA polymerase sigma factor [Segetibacter sp. 3557_3]